MSVCVFINPRPLLYPKFGQSRCGEVRESKKKKNERLSLFESISLKKYFVQVKSLEGKFVVH